ncbi:MAG: aminomethyltransferase family protein [Pseudomonadales bacterium]|nr:aminomethyltransferase family protein [Pseudomonadales bacterium]
MIVTMNSFDLATEKPKPSHFQPRLDELNIKEAWSAWNGYKFAEYYYEVEYEYFCVRNLCGTYDICPMQKYFISGADAERMLNRMVTRDVTKMKNGRVSYVLWCTDEGRLIDDGTIFRLGDEEFMLTCGSPSTAWLKKSCVGFDNLTIRDRSDDYAGLALQGPTSCAVLKKMGLTGIENAKPFTIHHFDFGGKPLMVSRTGFTGDLGYELWIDAEHAVEMWDALYAAGQDYGIHPFGEQATNMLRLEAGFIMPGYEFNEALKTVHFEFDQTPFELNLGWMVDFKKPHFNGRSALVEEARRDPKYTLTKLDIEGNKPADGSFIYNSKRCTTDIGYVTSAMWSPVVKSNIALAMIETPYLNGELWAEINYEKELRQFHKVARCKIQDAPFWSPERARLTPPSDF